MENQPTEQTAGVTVEQPMAQTVEPDSPAQLWYIVLAVAVVIGLGLLYFITKPPVTDEAPTDAQASTEQIQIPAPTEGNTIADISADLNQIEGSAAVLDADAAATAQDVQSF